MLMKYDVSCMFTLLLKQVGELSKNVNVNKPGQRGWT